MGIFNEISKKLLYRSLFSSSEAQEGSRTRKRPQRLIEEDTIKYSLVHDGSDDSDDSNDLGDTSEGSVDILEKVR